MSKLSPAFMHYLASLPRQEAGQHILDCLSAGDSSNEAWKLFDEALGKNWKLDAYSFSKVLDYVYKGAGHALR